MNISKRNEGFVVSEQQCQDKKYADHTQHSGQKKEIATPSRVSMISHQDQYVSMGDYEFLPFVSYL